MPQPRSADIAPAVSSRAARDQDAIVEGLAVRGTNGDRLRFSRATNDGPAVVEDLRVADADR